MPTFKPEKKKTPIPVLLHPPLVEAIFELRWELQTDQQTGRMRDASYPMMYGRLYERLKKDFPFVEDLPSTQAHPEATPFVPRHRLRKEANSYPLLQVGPGIATVNDTKGYSWSGFKTLILRLVESIIDLYPNGGPSINLIKSEIRYVNGIRFDASRENPLAFLGEKLHTKIELSPEFFEQNLMNDRPNAVGLNLAYALQKPMGNLGLSMNLGQFDNKPAYLVQTVIQSFGEMVPAETDSFMPWLDEAHEVAENCFQLLCKGALMDKFCGND